MYNLTRLSQADTVGEIAKTANEYSSAFPVMGAISIALFVIILFSMMRFGFVKALLTASYVSFFLTILLHWGGYVTIFFPIFFLSILAFAFLYTFFDK